MSSDTIKLLFTYLIATIVILGGLVMLFLTRLDPPETDVQGLRLLLAGFIGGAMSYVFTRETATQATRAAESAYRSAQPSVVTTGVGPGGTVTVDPSADPNP